MTHTLKQESSPHPASRILHPRAAFTLVELLVVITIIGILAALITVAAVGALRTAQKTRIKAEINEIATALDDLKNKTTAYPPNAQTAYGTSTSGETEPWAGGANITSLRLQALNDLRRYMKQAFPRHQENESLLQMIVDCNLSGNAIGGNIPDRLPGGMTAGEALVFWLGGFSQDPKYPISGEGGPSYPATLGKQDPIETRHWVYPLDITRLAPRDADNYFDDSAQGGGRYLVYPDPRDKTKSTMRRINFWQYTPSKSTQPFIYFDTSRHTPAEYDPPASPAVHVHAFKKIENLGGANQKASFVNPDKFQVLHCGIDDTWGEDLDLMAFPVYDKNKGNMAQSKFLAFPTGPFSGDIADTEVNFAAETTIEDSVK